MLVEYLRHTVLPWNYFGVAFYRNAVMMQLVRVAGVAGLSMLAALTNAALALAVLTIVRKDPEKGTLRYRDEKCVEIAEESVYSTTKELQYVKIPALGAGHHIKAELAAFLDHLENGTDFPSDVYQGTKTVAFAEAAIKSSVTGMPEKVDYNF